MKKIIHIALAALIMFTSAISVSANRRCDGDWKQKMMSEKIAFLTMEMDITPEEAQVFWPVYNQMEKKKDAALEQVIRSYKELNAAIEANNKNEIDKCLTAYLQAQETLREIESDTAEQYKAVLPVEKVAKLYVGEEKFRRQHIRKLHGGHANK
jgi:Spy/CpxP family protein refolding chaperone